MTEKMVDKYLVEMTKQIGQGSFANVYKGVNTENNQELAVKVISKEIINSDDYLRDNLMTEVSIMQQLKSPNIVQMLDVIETTNNYYIIQEYCGGGDYDRFLKEHKVIEEKSALKIFKDLLSGFIQLIKYGVIHRDLKPANILIHQNVYIKVFKLADFGFAQCVSNFQKDMLSSTVGTPFYMSPQVLDSKRYTSKTDIWSLGIIFYQTLYGKTPWNARSPIELLRNIRSQPVKFPKEINSTVSKNTQDFIIGLLQIEEVNRMSWDQVYQHPALEGYFDELIKTSQKMLEDRATYILNNFRRKILKEKIDITLLFNQLDMSKDKALDVNEIGRFFQKLDKDITREEIEYLFNKFDEDHSNSIEFEEFRKWLEDNDIQMRIKDIHKNALRLSTLHLPKSKPQGSIDVRAQYVLDKLKIAIVKYEINLYDLFKKYDKSTDRILDLTEITQLLRCIEPTIEQDEAQTIFQKFDLNGDGDITFDEFRNNLIECELFNQKSKSNKIIQEEKKKQ